MSSKFSCAKYDSFEYICTSLIHSHHGDVIWQVVISRVINKMRIQKSARHTLMKMTLFFFLNSCKLAFSVVFSAPGIWFGTYNKFPLDISNIEIYFIKYFTKKYMNMYLQLGLNMLLESTKILPLF